MTLSLRRGGGTDLDEFDSCGVNVVLNVEIKDGACWYDNQQCVEQHWT